MAQKIDFLVVGQGIVGTLFSHFVEKNGNSYHVCDKGSSSSSSAVSSGLINPITGRKYLKSWMIDEILPKALKAYAELEMKLHGRFVYPMNIARNLPSAKEENQWYGQRGITGYDLYMEESYTGPDYAKFLKNTSTFGLVKNGYSIDTGSLLFEFRKRLIENNSLIEDDFQYDEVDINKFNFGYRGVEYKNIVFAEGWKVINNPFFPGLRFQPAKGEVLICEIPEFPESHIVKFKKFFVPMRSSRFWIGSTYEWDFKDERGNLAKKEELESYMKEYLKVPYRILEWKTGIRPTTYNRRPFIGTHPEFDGMYLLNGFGTKGVSLAPYWSEKLYDFISSGHYHQKTNSGEFINLIDQH